LDKEFHKLWHKEVASDYERFEELWNITGMNWLDEISGGLVTIVVRMEEYHEFAELSGEEQYAFVMWLKRLTKEIHK